MPIVIENHVDEFVSVGTAPPELHRRRSALARGLTMSASEAAAIARQRYPEGLVCVECGRTLASRPESYSMSNLTEEARTVYLCAECRADDVAAARRADAHARKAETGRANLARARGRANTVELLTDVADDAVIRCSGDYTADERLALATYYAKCSPERLKSRRTIAPLASPSAMGAPPCRCRRGCCDTCQDRLRDRHPSLPCRSCGRPSTSTGDIVDPGASEFTCSWCLVGVAKPPKPADLGTRAISLRDHPRSDDISRGSTTPFRTTADLSRTAERLRRKSGRPATGTSRWARRRHRISGVAA
jgi:hypothetical protein